MIYDAGYVGPVTRGFLRAFSRALLQDQKDDVYQALDEQHQRRQLTSSPEPNNDFDYSLPLPSDDVMMSPYQPSENLESLHLRTDTPEQRPVFKSYLERILESKNRQNQGQSIFDHDSYSELTSTGVNAVINTSKFVIENTLSGLPEFSNSPGALSLALRLAEPVAFGNMSKEESLSNDSSEKENRPSGNSLSRRRSSFLEDGTITPTNYSTMELGKIDQMDIPQWESVLFDPSKLVTPMMDIGPFNEDMNEDLDNREFSDLSDNGLILGHFTIDNDQIEDRSFNLQPGLSVSEEPEIPNDFRKKERPNILEPLLPSRPRTTVGQGALPKSLVRGLVSVARRIPGQDDGRSPPRKRSRTERLPPQLMQLISSKSNQFLQQVMLDLEAYAGHRHSNQINLQDAVLYLNRIKSQRASASTIDNISMLAQSIFPVEMLVSLDNSLQESANKRLRKEANKATSEPNELLYTWPSTESSQESESFKSDESLADYDWEQ